MPCLVGVQRTVLKTAAQKMPVQMCTGGLGNETGGYEDSTSLPSYLKNIAKAYYGNVQGRGESNRTLGHFGRFDTM